MDWKTYQELDQERYEIIRDIQSDHGHVFSVRATWRWWLWFEYLTEKRGMSVSELVRIAKTPGTWKSECGARLFRPDLIAFSQRFQWVVDEWSERHNRLNWDRVDFIYERVTGRQYEFESEDESCA